MDFQTPEWVCKIMADLIPGIPETILEPTSGAGNLAKAIDRRFPSSIIYIPRTFEKFDKHHVDCIVTNPPFTPMKLGYQLLERFFELSDNIIILMPWLALINSESRTKSYIEHGLKQVIHLPRRAFEGARVQTCILVFEKGYHGGYYLQKCEDTMILFQPEHVQPTLDGIKIKTRRLGSCRWRVGSVHKAKTVMMSRDYFALLRILTIHREPLGAMTEKDAQEEGGYTLEGYKKEWEKINGINSWDPGRMVWVVQFERVFSMGMICKHCWQFVGCTSEKCCLRLLFEPHDRYVTMKEIIQFCCKDRCRHGVEYHDHSCPIKLAGVSKEHMWKQGTKGTNLPEKDGNGFVIKRLTDY